jgi:hypothetical protein
MLGKVWEVRRRPRRNKIVEQMLIRQAVAIIPIEAMVLRMIFAMSQNPM